MVQKVAISKMRMYMVHQMLPGQYDCLLTAGDPEQDKVRLSQCA